MKNITFDWILTNGTEVKIDAEVEIINRGPMYSDMQGDFGPDAVDVEIESIATYPIDINELSQADVVGISREVERIACES